MAHDEIAGDEKGYRAVPTYRYILEAVKMLTIKKLMKQGWRGDTMMKNSYREKVATMPSIYLTEIVGEVWNMDRDIPFETIVISLLRLEGQGLIHTQPVLRGRNMVVRLEPHGWLLLDAWRRYGED